MKNPTLVADFIQRLSTMNNSTVHAFQMSIKDPWPLDLHME